MTRYDNTFEGGTNGTALTTANSGGASGPPFTSVSLNGAAQIIYSSDHTAHGSLSAAFTPGGPFFAGVVYQGLSSKAVAARMYLYFTELNTNDMLMLGLAYLQAGAATVYLNPTGRLRLANRDGTVFTSTDPIPLNQWVRVEVFTTVGTTTSNGTITFASYLGDSLTPIDTFTSSATNTGTSALNRVRLAKFDNVSYVPTFWVDDIAMDDDASALIGPVPVTDFTGTADFVAGGSITAGGVVSVDAVVSFAGQGTIASSGKPAVVSPAVFTSSGTMTVTGAPSFKTVASFAGNGSLTATPNSPGFAATVNIGGVGVLTVTASPQFTAGIELTGIGALDVTGDSITRRDITATASIDARPWDATINPRGNAGTIGHPMLSSQLTPRTKTGTLTAPRWTGNL